MAPDDLQQRWMAAMRRGDFEAAWLATDAVEIPRRQAEKAGGLVWERHHLLWNGEPFAGRSVQVRCTHGLGDTLQFVRFLPEVRAVAREVTLLAQPALLELLRGEPGFGTVRNGWTSEPPPPHEVEIEIMELAYAFRCTPETLPARVPYLPRLATWARGRFLPPPAAGEALRVGLLWAASEWDSRRSVPLALLEEWGAIAGVCFYSLQQGRPPAERTEAPLPIRELAAPTHEIAEAAAAMAELDLIVTVDGMGAHLAGGLGRPVWVLLQHEADWRWMDGRADSPWYPTMRLFRQPRPGDWTAAVQAVGVALAEEVRRAARGCH